MNQQEQEFLREKQKILKSMPDSVAFPREEAKLLETMTEELLEYKRICSLSELKMLCEDAERYAALYGFPYCFIAKNVPKRIV